jgi:hypothetical protein
MVFTTEDKEDTENHIYQTDVILRVLCIFSVVELLDYEVCPRLIKFANS